MKEINKVGLVGLGIVLPNAVWFLYEETSIISVVVFVFTSCCAGYLIGKCQEMIKKREKE